VPWYRSQRFTALWQSAAVLSLGWLMVALQTGTWDWRTGLLVPILGNVILVLRDWTSPTVQAPIPYLNRNNVQGPLSSSTMADVIKRQG
jgi:hypothetical protein